NIPAVVRQQLHTTAIKAAQAIDYVGAGTLEFLLDESNFFYFMEMNTRLQVEHPITEMITGYDLVEWQLKIAAGESLPVTQADIKIQGHAIETRICAENPQQDFLPSAGKIHFLQFPQTTAEIRIDSGIITGDTITSYYDPLLAKLIVHGASREQAITRLTQALMDCQIVGIQTNLGLLKNLVKLADFNQGRVHTHLIAQHQAHLLTSSHAIQPTAWLAVGLFILLQQQQMIAKQAQLSTGLYSPWYATDGWRLNTQSYSQIIELQSGQQQCALHITHAVSGYIIRLQEKSYQVTGYLEDERQLRLIVDGGLITYKIIQIGDLLHLIGTTETLIFEPILAKPSAATSIESSLLAQLPGTLVALFVQPDEIVKQGTPLLAVEAMKMEHVLRAPYAGKVEAIYYQVGEQVAEGAELINLTELTDGTILKEYT
ncbi:MAG: 3-methylcrotonyl-CoA carboxylase subunit alpha, partial [Gammaproteobacteria bacterium]|nr:3-methylcrotonyl-CoA carboxylase subunit alpha [Gammaproteobacteria bacterium]